MSAISWLDRLSGAVLRYLSADMPQRGSIEFVGSGVVVTDDETNDKSIVTIAGGSSSGGAGQVQASDGTGGFVATPATIYLGTNAIFGTQSSAVNVYAATAVALGIGGLTYLYVSGGNVEHWKPITGSALGSSPYGAHGGVAFVAASANTVTPAQYALQRITLAAGGFLVAPFTADFPLPASAAAGYGKTIINDTAQTATITAGGGAGTTRTLGAGLGQRFWFDDSGVSYDGPTFTP